MYNPKQEINGRFENPMRILTRELWQPLVFVVLCSLIQCLSVWNYGGDHVDESELVHYAVGFLGGGLDPFWYGYGYVGMCLLGAVYFVVGLVYLSFGRVDSLLEFASLLFDSDLFMILGRLVFAAVGALTIWLYILLARRLQVPSLLTVVFALISVFAGDSLRYANYVRCDQLVALLCPIILLELTRQSASRRDIWLLPVLVAVAFNCKMSALSLTALIPMNALRRSSNNRELLRNLIIGILVFVVCMWLANPFNNVFATMLDMITNMIFESRVSVSKVGHIGFWATTVGIGEVLRSTIGLSLLLPLFLLPILPKYCGWNGFFILSMFLLLSGPYYLTSEIAEYWFIPLFSLSRFSAFLIISIAVGWLSYSRPRIRGAVIVVTAFGLLLASYKQFFVQYPRFFKTSLAVSTNARLASQWLLPELRKGRVVLLDKYWNHVMPKIYGNDRQQAKLISRAFIYERKRNLFLNKAFDLFMEKRYLPQFSVAPMVRQAVAYDEKDYELERERRAGAYFVVSPSIANRYLLADLQALPEQKRQETQFLKRYYELEMRGDPIIEFSEGSGAPLRVYEIK